MRGLGEWFASPGAYVMVDGQFGSTGKGLLASYLAARSDGKITVATTNAGPNSGHTAYWSDEKIMLQQLPMASVIMAKMGYPVLTYLNAGAVIEPSLLDSEVIGYISPDNLAIHPCAAVISKGDQANDQAIVAGVAGTGKGVGPAIARKVMRGGAIVARDKYLPVLPEGRRSWDDFWNWDTDVVFVETAQGYSLGINSARFYPHVTSRECTVQQALADARIPITEVRKVVACFRTYPIRVGNSPSGGYSGDCYADQEELTWDAIGQPAELTTVTKRVRRVFSWSRTQFRECLATNRPDVIFLNFCNYLKADRLKALCFTVLKDYEAVMGQAPDEVLLGFGPHLSDISTIDSVFSSKEFRHV